MNPNSGVEIDAGRRGALSSRPGELDALLSTLITRITRTLVRAGVLVAEDEQPYLDLAMDSPYEQLAGAAVRYVIATDHPGRTRHDASTTPVAGHRAERR